MRQLSAQVGSQNTQQEMWAMAKAKWSRDAIGTVNNTFLAAKDIKYTATDRPRILPSQVGFSEGIHDLNDVFLPSDTLSGVNLPIKDKMVSKRHDSRAYKNFDGFSPSSSLRLKKAYSNPGYRPSAKKTVDPFSDLYQPIRRNIVAKPKSKPAKKAGMTTRIMDFFLNGLCLMFA